MAKESYEIYQRRKPLKIILKLFISIVLIVIALAVIVFFWFQSYIVYTSDGIRLDIPFLQSDDIEETEQPSETAGQD